MSSKRGTVHLYRKGAAAPFEIIYGVSEENYQEAEELLGRPKTVRITDTDGTYYSFPARDIGKMVFSPDH